MKPLHVRPTPPPSKPSLQPPPPRHRFRRCSSGHYRLDPGPTLRGRARCRVALPRRHRRVRRARPRRVPHNRRAVPPAPRARLVQALVPRHCIAAEAGCKAWRVRVPREERGGVHRGSAVRVEERRCG
ncbi:hypothetical protein V8G54_028662 [Vigna mungo]|uniref:Uncharacterized protein n=1 Tax=Vigna mungo TaxID=3915 RepID=A0AAQ3MSU9_VIGMU